MSQIFKLLYILETKSLFMEIFRSNKPSEISNRKVLNFSPLGMFIIKAISIFVFWRLAYDLVLLPDGRIDYFMSISGVQTA